MRTFELRTEQQKAWFSAYVLRLPLEPVQQFTQQDYVPRRTNPQNARHWALLSEAAKHIGCSVDELHDDLLCQHYGYEEIRMPSGAIRRRPLKRSSQRNVKEFSEFMEFCEAFLATELGVWV